MKDTAVQFVSQMNKKGKFLEKMWCCVGGGNWVIWFFKADISIVSPSSALIPFAMANLHY